MKPLNVLYLMRTWAFGGSHTILLLLLKHLPRDRFNVTCVPYDTFDGGDEAFVREAERWGLAVAEERIPWRSRANWWRARETVSDLIRKYEIDLIHTHDTHSTVLVGWGRGRWPCACVASAYGWWNSVFPIRRRVYQILERNYSLPNFERIITVSNHMKGKILRGKRNREERIRVVHTGLEVAETPPGDSGAHVREQFGIPESACVVGTVSRVYPEKGHRYLLEAAKHLLPKQPHLHLLIVGAGPLVPELQARARDLGVADHVTFTGFFDDLRGALAAMDIFAQPSILEEGFPTAILEAEYAGLPVVASDIGGTAETLDVGVTGALAPPRDPAGLARALEPLVADVGRRTEMGRAAREWVTRSFTLERMVDLVAAAYDEAVAEYEARRRGAGADH